MPLSTNYTDPVSYTSGYVIDVVMKSPTSHSSSGSLAAVLSAKNLVNNVPTSFNVVKGGYERNPTIFTDIAIKFTTYPPVYRTSLGNTASVPEIEDVYSPRLYPPIAGIRRK